MKTPFKKKENTCACIRKSGKEATRGFSPSAYDMVVIQTVCSIQILKNTKARLGKQTYLVKFAAIFSAQVGVVTESSKIAVSELAMVYHTVRHTSVIAAWIVQINLSRKCLWIQMWQKKNAL
ncbi:hypothetical protein PR048_013229 [Dryococelus australis]|uniref:Uncharacterized protein n=1 Tax=Dryococelus australis TaxID=614101 RepID=A0ABQ9HRW5_9NEOP|nr:hypothetical protein PR048_013229 [Dryococelus australis]